MSTESLHVLAWLVGVSAFTGAVRWAERSRELPLFVGFASVGTSMVLGPVAAYVLCGDDFHQTPWKAIFAAAAAGYIQPPIQTFYNKFFAALGQEKPRVDNGQENSD